MGDLQSDILLTPAEDVLIEEGITALEVSGDVYNCTDFEYDGAPSDANLIVFKVMKDRSSIFEVTLKNSDNLSLISTDQTSGIVVFNIVHNVSPLGFIINVLNGGESQQIFDVVLTQVLVQFSPTPHNP